MKLTKTLMAALAMTAFAAPMTASAQVVPGDIVGEVTNLVGDTVILRNGNFLQAANGSALMANDEVFSRDGSATLSLTGCNGKFNPCSQTIASGMKVMVGTGDVCSNLGNMVRIGARDAVMSAGTQTVSAGGVSSAGGSVLGSAGGLPLAAIGAVIAGGALIAVLSDDDDDDSGSN